MPVTVMTCAGSKRVVCFATPLRVPKINLLSRFCKTRVSVNTKGETPELLTS